MAKLSYSIALNLLTQNVKRGATEIEGIFKKMRSTITGAFANLGIGLGIASFGRQMIQAGKDFEAGMARVRAVSNATQSEFKAMEDEAKRLGSTTKYTATEAANALENLVRNGLNPSQATTALPKVLQFAQANSIGLAEAADLLTNTLNGFNMSVDKSSVATDVMSSTAAHSATNVLDLGEALKNAAPLANNCGIAIQETNAALGTLANVGIKGADAGTGLKQFLIGLSSEAPKGAKAMEKYGLKINQATLAADGLAGTLKKLHDSGVGKDNQALADIFGRRAFSSAAALINNYEKFISLNDTLANSEGETARMFEQSTGKMENALASLASAWEGLQIRIFQSSENWFVAPLNALTDFIRYATDNLGGLITRIGILFAGAKIIKYFREWKAASGTFYNSMAAQAQAAHNKVNALERNTARLKSEYKSLETRLAKASANERLQIEVQLEAKKRALLQNHLQWRKANNAAIVADEKASALKSLRGWQLFSAQVKTSLTSIGTAVKSAFSKVAPMVWLTVITQIVEGLTDVYNKVINVSSATKEYNKIVGEVERNKEISDLSTILQLLERNKDNQDKVNYYIGEANKALGTSLTTYQDINTALRERIDLLRKAATAEGIKNVISDLEGKNAQILAKYGVSDKAEFDKKLRAEQERWFSSESFREMGAIFGVKSMLSEGVDLENNTRVLNGLYPRLDKLNGNLEESNKNGGNNNNNNNTKTGEKKTKKSELEQLQESYNQQLRELTLKYQSQMMTLPEYEKALSDLIQQTYISVAGGKKLATRQSEFAKTLKIDADVMRSNEDYWKMVAAEEDYKKTLDGLTRSRENGVLSDEDYNKALQQLIKSTLDDVSKLNVTGGALEELIKALRDMADKTARASLEPEKQRDKTFDYKKSASQIAGEELEQAKKRLEELKTAAGGTAGILIEDINAQMAKVTSLEEALKIAQVKEDLKELRKAFVQTEWNGIKDVVSNTRSAGDAIASLAETLSNEDATAWERMLAVWNAFTSITDSIIGVTNAIDTWTEASDRLKAAEEAEAAMHTTTTTRKVAENAQGMASDAAAGAATVAKARTDVAANTADAASGAAVGAAKLPFPASLIAVGSAVAAVLSILAALPKFANGGIVGSGGVISGGASVGDMQLARVNAGEMILNGTQQARLWNAINGDSTGGTSRISGYKIKGTDLYIIIENVKKKFKK